MRTTTQTSARIRFEVADVMPATKPLKDTSAKLALERTTRTRALVCSNPDGKVLEQGDFHPLIAAAFLAFKQHYPLVLSPDMIWLTILQGVAQHIQNNAEALRKRLVFHETKIELVVDTNFSSWPQNDEQMLLVTREFVARIAAHAPSDKHFLFQTEFSTTTDIDRIASSVAIMDAFQPYFDYVMYCICGIPSVILEGTPEDWALLKSKVQCLHGSDLELSWWTKHLVPLCEQFVRAACGDVDRDHWQNLCKSIRRYGVDDLNGWLLKFIPYLRHERNEPAIHKNPVLELSVFPDPAGTREELGSNKITGCTSDMLPSGISRAPVTLVNRYSGLREQGEFVAGLTGIVQSRDDLSVRATTGWAICEGAAVDRGIARLRLEHEIAPPKGEDPWEMNRILGGFLPADVWRFYSETDGAVVTGSVSRPRCRILPLNEIKPVWDRGSFRDELEASQKRGELTPNELKEWQDFNSAFSGFRRIAELDNGTSYVLGDYPDVWSRSARSLKPWPSTQPRESRAVFLWTGQCHEDSFAFAAPSFADWLASLLDGKCIHSAD